MNIVPIHGLPCGLAHSDYRLRLWRWICRRTRAPRTALRTCSMACDEMFVLCSNGHEPRLPPSRRPSCRRNGFDYQIVPCHPSILANALGLAPRVRNLAVLIRAEHPQDFHEECSDARVNLLLLMAAAEHRRERLIIRSLRFLACGSRSCLFGLAFISGLPASAFAWAASAFALSASACRALAFHRASRSPAVSGFAFELLVRLIRALFVGRMRRPCSRPCATTRVA